MNMHFTPSTDVVGYTHSDGYCLCVNHGTDDQGNELRDPGNETGKVYPIFAGDETNTNMVCDVCLAECVKNGTDPSVAVILEANTDTEEDTEDPSQPNRVVTLDVVEEFVRGQKNIEHWLDLHGHRAYRFTDGEQTLALGTMAIGEGLYSVTVDRSVQKLWDEHVARHQARQDR